MQYGSIGWSVGATLGYAQSVPNKRIIACIGDGSFHNGSNMLLKQKFEKDKQYYLSIILLNLKELYFRRKKNANVLGNSYA